MENKEKKTVTLYNIIFPIWAILALPPIILITLPVNYLIDYLVTRISLKKQGNQEYKKIAKKFTWKIWLVGFLSDFIGVLGMFLCEIFNGRVAYYVEYNCFRNIWAFLYVMICISVSGVLIYFLNLKLSLRKTDLLSLEEKKKLALHLAIFTAPYTFLIPTFFR